MGFSKDTQNFTNSVWRSRHIEDRFLAVTQQLFAWGSIFHRISAMGIPQNVFVVFLML